MLPVFLFFAFLGPSISGVCYTPELSQFLCCIMRSFFLLDATYGSYIFLYVALQTYFHSFMLHASSV